MKESTPIIWWGLTESQKRVLKRYPRARCVKNTIPFKIVDRGTNRVLGASFFSEAAAWYVVATKLNLGGF